MKSKWLAVSTFLQAHILAADAQIFGLTDPRLCYLLDGILFFYAIIVTALFFREKLIKKARKNGEVEDNYSHLHPDTRAMHSHTDNKRGNAKLDNSALYQALEKDKLNEPYSGINVKQQPHKKKGREHDKVYQGLNAAQRDTYDALQMQPIR